MLEGLDVADARVQSRTRPCRPRRRCSAHALGGMDQRRTRWAGRRAKATRATRNVADLRHMKSENQNFNHAADVADAGGCFEPPCATPAGATLTHVRAAFGTHPSCPAASHPAACVASASPSTDPLSDVSVRYVRTAARPSDSKTENSTEAREFRKALRARLPETRDRRRDGFRASETRPD